METIPKGKFVVTNDIDMNECMDCSECMDKMLDAFEEEDMQEQETVQDLGGDDYDGDIDFEDDIEMENGSNDGLLAKAKQKIMEFKSFITGQGFKDLVEETHNKTGISRKQLADGFFKRVLGTIGDTLGVVIEYAGHAGHMLVNVLETVLHGGINIICKVANAVVSLVTLNQTNVA